MSENHKIAHEANFLPIHFDKENTERLLKKILRDFYFLEIKDWTEKINDPKHLRVFLFPLEYPKLTWRNEKPTSNQHPNFA